MRGILTLLLAFIGFSAFAQGTFASKGGAWNSAANWTLSSGTDPDGIPDADDIVNINGFTVTVSGTEACSTLTINPTTTTDAMLTIEAAGTLTVNGQMNVNNSRFTNTNTINVNGNLTVTGLFRLNPTSQRNNVTLNIGADVSHSPVLTFGSYTANRTDTAGFTTIVNFYQGTIDINGAITIGGTPLGQNLFNVIDDGAYDGLPKHVYYSGVSTSASNQRFMATLTDANGNADYTWTYDGNNNQVLLSFNGNSVFKNIVVDNNGYSLQLLDDLDFPGVFTGTIEVLSGSVFSDSAQNIALNPNTIHINAGARFRRVNSSVYDLASFTLDPASVFEFHRATISGQSDILNSLGNYYSVELTGAGTKRITAASSIDDVNNTVGSINVLEGTLTVASTADLILNNSNGQTKTITLNSGTKLNIGGNITSSGAFYDLDLNSTVSYNGAAQDVYDLQNSSFQSEAYGKLDFAGSGLKSIIGTDNILVRDRVSFTSATADLRFTGAGYLTLLSTAAYTGTIGALATGNTINYGTSGNIVVQKYISFPGTNNQNYRDFTSPIQSSTLENFEETGLELTGLVNSNYPTLDVNAYYYDEPTDGIADNGWVAASNTNEDIAVSPSSTSISRGAWRIYCGSPDAISYTLSDTGQIFIHDITFPLTFNHGSGDPVNDDGYHLMGNPFPSNIDWDLVVANNPSVIIDGMTVTEGVEPTIYLYRPTDKGNQVDDSQNYSSYNALTGVGDEVDVEGIITEYQGFWIKVTDDIATSTTYNLTIPESAKTTTSTVFYKTDRPRPEVISITVSDGVKSEKIGFHTFPNATLRKDKGFDVAKLKNSLMANPTNTLMLDFAYNEESLEVRYNAIPEGIASFTMPLYVTSTGAGVNQSLTFNNLEAISSNYECVSLHDLATDTWVDLKSTSVYNYTMNQDFTGVRFILSFENSIENVSTIVDATCFDSEDGLLRVKFQNEDFKNYDLFKGNDKLYSFKGEYNAIKTTLSNGSYKLVNKLAAPSCAVANYTFTVNSQPEILFNIETSTPEIYTGQSVQFNNSTSGAQSFIWTFLDDNSTSSEVSPVHTFANAGTVAVQLEAISANEQCNKAKVFNYNVLDASSITNTLSSSDVSVLVKPGFIQINNNTSSSFDYTLMAIDGRIVEKQSGVTGQHSISVPSVSGSYLLMISSQGKTRTEKFVF